MSLISSSSAPLLRRLAALLLLLGAGIGPGAIPAAPQGGPADEGAQASPSQSAPRFDSPRAVVDAFLDGMRDWDYELALSTFPDGYDDEEVALGLAQDLYFVLQRTRVIKVKELPGPEYGAKYFFEWLIPLGRPDLRVNLATVWKEGRGWRLSEDLLASVPRLREAFADLPISAELLAEMGPFELLRARLVDYLGTPVLARTFLLANWQWVGLLLLLFLAVVVDRLTRFVVGIFARRFATQQSVKLEPDVLLSFERPVGLFAAAQVFEFFLVGLQLRPGEQGVLLLAASVIATLAGVWAAYRLVDLLCDSLVEKAKQTENRFDDMLVPLLRRTLKLFVLVVGLVYVASRMTADVWGVVAGLGLGTIAFGFAARDSIENLFGTFTVLMDKPFQIGDWIIVGDLEGTVESVGFRSTRIRTFYDSQITVPNRTFISSNVDNMGERRYRRVKTTLSLTYDTPAEKVEAFCEGVRQIVRSHPYTRKDYYHVYLTQLGASSLDVLLYCFVATPDWGTELREKHRLLADVLRLAEELKVGFAFPTQTIHMAKPEDLLHPDRPPDDPAGARVGREAADRVVGASLSPFGGPGHRPPPVTTPTGPVGEDGDG